MKSTASRATRLQAVRQLAKIGLMSTVLLPALAFAQNSGGNEVSARVNPDETLFADIVGTAQKRDQRTQDVGIAIAAFESKQMSALGVVDVKNLATPAPGFTAAKSFRGSPIYTLRGIGFDTPKKPTSSPIGVYLDEVADPYPIMTEGLSLDLSNNRS